MDDLDQYEEDCERIKEENKKILDEFEDRATFIL